jgi:hypothetical protein
MESSLFLVCRRTKQALPKNGVTLCQNFHDSQKATPLPVVFRQAVYPRPVQHISQEEPP